MALAFFVVPSVVVESLVLRYNWRSLDFARHDNEAMTLEALAFVAGYANEKTCCVSPK